MKDLLATVGEPSLKRYSSVMDQDLPLSESEPEDYKATHVVAFPSDNPHVSETICTIRTFPRSLVKTLPSALREKPNPSLAFRMCNAFRGHLTRALRGNAGN